MLETFDIFLFIQRVIDVENSLIILQKTEKHLQLGVLNRVVFDVERCQIRVAGLGKGISDHV